ncbi:MAG: FAD-dependent oxidoreductase [Bowdeniella nasicola]|nr:FAD-dependent oxidoreductase [Bowdeniella nasicola]
MSEQLMDRVVIVGAGQAAIACATALRRGGWKGPITMIGREVHLPYERPPLSKKVLLGVVSGDQIALTSEDALAELDVTFQCATVAAIDRERRTVTLADGGEVRYDHLVLATGSAARALPASLPGAEGPGVHVIRTLDDALTVAQLLDQVRDVAVVGGGFIGVEVAAALALADRQVCLLEAVDHLLARVAPPRLGRWVRDYLTRLGVDVQTGTGLAQIEREGERILAVHDTAGVRHAADLVIVGIGGVAEVEYARDAGLEVDGAIVVDDELVTSDPRVFAIGDCALQRRADGSIHRYESVQTAQDQGRYVARRLLGTHRGPYAEVPWFWSDIGPIKIQMAGRIDQATDIVVRGDEASESFSLFGYCDGAFVGMAAINRTLDYMAARMFLNSGANLPASAAADESADLRALARAAR